VDLVSIVIPCYNPGEWLLDAIASARAQTYSRIEIVLVDDGTVQADSLDYIRVAATRVDLVLQQANLGLPAARNAGMRAAGGRFVLPLDADDLLDPRYVAECVAAMSSPEPAFVYSDCRVFGERQYVDALPEYSLYSLLDRNFLSYAALISREEWERAGGYDESMRLGYEDWEFWLRLGAANRFGRRLPQPLFHYRKRKGSLYDVALAHHAEIVAYIESKHPELYDASRRARIKAAWAPAVCFAGPPPAEPQTIEDICFAQAAQTTPPSGAAEAPAWLVPGKGELDRQSGELAALAVWAGRRLLRLPDGSMAVSREYAVKHKRRLEPGFRWDGLAPQPASGGTSYWSTLHRNLANADLLSVKAWAFHPLRSALRLIPLRVKERVNSGLGRPVFDLTFYLRFQPRSLWIENIPIQPLRYCPRVSPGRIRVALITPHLGDGGAEAVLMEIAGALPADRFEVLLLATHSTDNRWSGRWSQSVAHVYDLARIVPARKTVAAIYSIVTNWKCAAVLVQNSLAGYSALPPIKRDLPHAKLMDLVHSVDEDWDLISVTAGLAAQIDVRIAVSGAVRSRLLACGTPEDHIAMVRNGVDLGRFRPARETAPPQRRRILFAGRLDPIKRPTLLVDIASELLRLRKQADFVFAVAGEGPQASLVRALVRRNRLERVFELLGHVEDMPPLIAAADIVLLPSRSEGVPLIVLESLACATPVVASKVGALAEAVDESCGVLIDPDGGEACAFAAAIDRLLNHPGLRRKMGEAGRKKVAAQYDLDRAREAYRTLFG
jgi:glycosyltransferase involved in cell wall biosynthesis/GT2 family glycosyltransferase